MSVPDPLADVLRQADAAFARDLNAHGLYENLARAAREHIAGEVLFLRPGGRRTDADVEQDRHALAQRVYYDAVTDVSARIARGGTS